MLLSGLITILPELLLVNDNQFDGVAINSLCVKPGDLFCAYPGVSADGRDFISDAVKIGAAAVLVEKKDISNQQLSSLDLLSIPCALVENLQSYVGPIAAKFYRDPSQKLNVIGVTGTNGKSSFVSLLSQALSLLGRRVGVIGTLGVGMLDDQQVATHTTPDAIQLQASLAGMVQKNADTVVMEVSSHGLDQGRVNGIEFDIAVFTNITRDHLDYHGDMASYQVAKERLFQYSSVQLGVVNIDDSFGRKLFDKYQQNYSVVSYSNHHADADIFAEQVSVSLDGISAQVHTPKGVIALRSKLLGRFNLDNLLAVISVLVAKFDDLKAIEAILPQLNPVPGRMETIGGGEKPLCIVDYAHTPDALEKLLMTAKELLTSGRLICVFGCGGDRDVGKRSLMAGVAEQYADYIIITNDNPRNEQPEKIFNDIVSGFSNADNYECIPERELAIKQAICQAKAEDIVVIAGKGHEEYQIIQGKRLDFGDANAVRKVLEAN